MDRAAQNEFVPVLGRPSGCQEKDLCCEVDGVCELPAPITWILLPGLGGRKWSFDMIVQEAVVCEELHPIFARMVGTVGFSQWTALEVRGQRIYTANSFSSILRFFAPKLSPSALSSWLRPPQSSQRPPFHPTLQKPYNDSPRPQQ